MSEKMVTIHDSTAAPMTAPRVRRAAQGLIAALALTLAACGGSKEEEAVADVPPSRSEAARFLTQASFGPTPAEIDRVMALGYRGWIEDQFARPASSHRAFWETQDAAVKAANPTNTSATIGQDGIYNSFWRHALTADDQVRQRTAFALSQIFVISMQGSSVAAWTKEMRASLAEAKAIAPAQEEDPIDDLERKRAARRRA